MVYHFCFVFVKCFSSNGVFSNLLRDINRYIFLFNSNVFTTIYTQRQEREQPTVRAKLLVTTNHKS